MIIRDRKEIDNKKILIMTSIGGAPIHEGHCRVIRNCKPRFFKKIINDSCPEDPDEYYQKVHVKNEMIGTPTILFHPEQVKLLVVVNCDDFLSRKHGFSFQNEDSRAEIIDAIKDVDYTYIHHSDKQTIDDAIYYFQPHYFCKGGDRSGPEFMPECELEAAKSCGCTILYGVGGSDKVSSSSDLMKRCAKHYLFEENVEKWMDKDDIVRLTQGEYPRLG